ncbi:MAG: hypothetical protein PHX30_00275 [Candidatus Pacebacteria bacterium]|nr:hypothetical protein [Candidatus Paceibacterota bacterium]
MSSVRKNIIRTFFYIGLFFIVIGNVFGSKDYLLQQIEHVVSTSNEISDVDFPSQLENPKTVDFQWSYRGKEYSIKETFYGNIDAYYKEHPVKALYEGRAEDEYYENFALNLEHEEDPTINDVVNDIKSEGVKNNLSEEEILELVISFVQDIPYDDAKYDLIESASGNVEESWTRFPYEVLYDNTGICTDKSMLTVALVEKLNYGTALFGFDKKEHMVPAIQCTQEYSSYYSGYCYTEVTNVGFKIGDSTAGDIEGGKAVAKSSIVYTGGNQLLVPDAVTPEDLSIYGKRSGVIYDGVIETVDTMHKITELENQLHFMSLDVENAKKDYLEFVVTVEDYKKQADDAYNRHLIKKDASSYNSYLALHKQYGVAYSQYEGKVKIYNDRVNEYNNLANEYNSLIKSFYN